MRIHLPALCLVLFVAEASSAQPVVPAAELVEGNPRLAVGLVARLGGS